MEEIWKSIPKYKDYLVSNLGRVKSLKHKNEYFMTPYVGKNGYKVHTFSLNDKIKIVYLHRLIAEAFIPNPENKKQIDHIDGCRTNNSITNLRWVTAKENINNPVAITRMKKANRPQITEETRKKLSEIYVHEAHDKPVICLTTGTIYKSAADAQRKTGAGRHIVDCCKGRRNFCGGFKWAYA